jgi:ferredoxin
MKNILTLYFSGTGNTQYIAESFSGKTGALCLSIEDGADFGSAIRASDTVAFCYPIYGSRVPLIMREFAAQFADALRGKKLIIFVTQVSFSGDGARVLCDLFPKGHVEVVYAEHFAMPNNVCNLALFRKTSGKNIESCLKRAEKKMERVCRDIQSGIIKKRGFSAFSRMLGLIQGKPWQGDSRNAFAVKGTMEYKSKHSVRIGGDCNVCNICAERCPMRNLRNERGKIVPHNNCTVCYRCVNLCPQRAISVFFKSKPKWQYKGIGALK